MMHMSFFLKSGLFTKALFWVCLTANAAIVAQPQTDGFWRDHLSYTQATDIVQTPNRVYCSTARGIIVVDKEELSIDKLNKLNGLSDVVATCLGYHAQSGRVVVGYNNGNIDIVYSDGVINLNDIVRSNQYIGRKRINSIRVMEGRAYLSTGFGVVVIDIARALILETWIIGPNGLEMEVFKTAIDPATRIVYAATELGLYTNSLDNNPFYFANWTLDAQLSSGPVNHVVFFQNKPFVAIPDTPDDKLYYYENNTWTEFSFLGTGTIHDLRVTQNSLSICSDFNAVTYNAGLIQENNISIGGFGQGNFRPMGYIIDNQDPGLTYLANAQGGLFRFFQQFGIRRLTPDGPYSNNAYKLYHDDDNLWVAAGAVNDIWAPLFVNDGIMAYGNFRWSHIGGVDVLGAVRDIMDVHTNPNDKSQVFAASWNRGLIEFKDGEIVNIYNENNTGGAITGVGGDVNNTRVGGLDFDVEGNLWVSISQGSGNNVLAKLSPAGQWSKHALVQSTAQRIMAHSNGQVWVQTRNNGILVYSPEINQTRTLNNSEGSGNLPSNGVNTFAEDAEGEVWIGTNDGLVVLYNPQNIFDDSRNHDALPILFEEEGVVQRLLGPEAVSAIKVDGANRKWIGTRNAGVFYVSSDGLQVIHRFTEQNSPLISNTIIDIEIDNENGEVFFATPLGIQAYRGSATRGEENYTNVYAYPNPVEPGYQGPIAIRGLVTNARVKITDIEGNLVADLVADGGQAFWYGTNQNGRPVASGVYVAYVSNNDGSKTHVTKILIVR